MDSNTNKTKWRLNVFDIVFVIIVLVAAWLVISYLGRSGRSVAITGATETIEYTIELTDMIADTAYLIRPGDALVDNVQNRQMGTIVSVDVIQTMRLEKNFVTAERVVSEVPGRLTAVITVRAGATITENQITIPGGFIIRVGTRISVNGPNYHGSGFIIDVERNDAS